MSQIHTDLPEHRGERRLAQQLVQILPGNAHIWFDIDALPSVPEIDILLAIPDVGCFCIEVKAVGLNAIESFSLNHVKIQGRKQGPSPQKQAYRAALGLRNYLYPRIKKVPFFVATAWWPLISR